MGTELAGRLDDGAPIRLQVARALPRNRLTVFFRLILAIPQLIVVYALTLAATLVVVMAWFSALVLGRMPTWMREFVGFTMIWAVRVLAYLYLVTDVYPPFGSHAPDHPVQVLLPPPGRLRRWAVFGRLVLVVPGYVIATVLGGVQLLVVFAWFAGVFAGRMPRAVFDAIATVLRYQLRAVAYFALLTPTYPWGPLGDSVEPKVYAPVGGWSPYPPGAYPPAPPAAYPYPPTPPPADGSPPAPPRPRPSPLPGSQPPAAPAAHPAYPAYPAYPSYPVPPAAPVAAAIAVPGSRTEPAWYDGIVSDGGRVLLIVALVLGSIQGVGNLVLQATTGFASFGSFGHFSEEIRLTAAKIDFDDAVDDASCSTAGPGCTTAVADSLLGQAEGLDRFASGSGAAGERAQLGDDLTAFETDVRRAAAAGTLVDASGEVTDTAVLEAETSIDDDITALEHRLR